ALTLLSQRSLGQSSGLTQAPGDELAGGAPLFVGVGAPACAEVLVEDLHLERAERQVALRGCALVFPARLVDGCRLELGVACGAERRAAVGERAADVARDGDGGVGALDGIERM